MARLILQGNKEMIITEAQADRIHQDMVNNTLQDVYAIGALTIRSSLIKMVDRESAKPNRDAQHFEQTVQESKESYLRMSHWTPERKAQANMEYYKMMWFSNTGSWDVDKREDAMRLAANFFIQSPRRTIVDLNLWKPLIPLSPMGTEYPMKESIRESGLNILSQMMRQDMWNAQHIWRENISDVPPPIKRDDEINVAEISF